MISLIVCNIILFTIGMSFIHYKMRKELAKHNGTKQEMLDPYRTQGTQANDAIAVPAMPTKVTTPPPMTLLKKQENCSKCDASRIHFDIRYDSTSDAMGVRCMRCQAAWTEVPKTTAQSNSR